MSSPETVKIYTYDESDQPLADVLVRAYDATGTTFITQQYSSLVDDLAVAELTLDGDTPEIEYTIRLSKSGVAFDGSLGDSSKSPQLISVISPVTTVPNAFDVVGETFVRPTATDPRLCRCSGFFLDISGRPLVGLDMTFINEFSPTVMDGSAVMGSEVHVTTDRDGYVELDLYRNGRYAAWVPGVEAPDTTELDSAIAYPRYMAIPDQGSANLPDLLFPVVLSVDLGVSSVSVGCLQTVVLTPTVTSSDGRVLVGAAVEDVIYAVADVTVAGISTSATSVSIVGIAEGTTSLSVVRKDLSITKIPNTSISGQPITITVTP